MRLVPGVLAGAAGRSARKARSMSRPDSVARHSRAGAEPAGERMTLYTCPWQRRSSGWHPCGVAAKALDAAGHRYEIRGVRGQLSMPWTWISRRRDRAEVRALTGQNAVPVLVLASGEVVTGSARIAEWAAGHPAPGATGEQVPPLGGEVGHLGTRGGS